MKIVYTALLTIFLFFYTLLSYGQKNLKWGSNCLITTKLVVLNMSEDPTFPDSLNLSVHPMFQILPGLSFKYYKNKTAYRIDANYSQNYTNSKAPYNNSDYYSEANHSSFDIQFGFEHKFQPARFYPYCFVMIMAGYHNALGNSYSNNKPFAFNFEIFDINAGLTGGYGFYFFIFKQLSINAEMNALFLNTWNNYTVSTNSYQETWNNYNFSVRASATMGMNYYFNQK